MELDDLKTQWHDLDKRLDHAGTKIDRLTAEVASGKFTSAKQRLTQTLRMGIAILLLLPGPLMYTFRFVGEQPAVAFYIVLGLFFFAMLIREITLLVMLSRISPETQTVRDACNAVLRFRRSYLAGVAMGVILAVPLLVLLGMYMAKITTPYMLYGFIGGLVVGLPIGIRVYRRIMGEIDALRSALQDTVD
ncbi:hypothetical protein [uncultured Alistipes sp.]|jgi:hypothetical protein|uniref:hypothetical protein n=1 Tax=uncultured Alistipes sp. TaxID=538949 RepID=UPI0025D6EE7A|nr:hypothetical protein [uncultured Alistipes sp.]